MNHHAIFWWSKQGLTLQFIPPLRYTNRLPGQQETKLTGTWIHLFSSRVLVYVGKHLTSKRITKPGVDTVLAQQHLNLDQNTHPSRSTAVRQRVLHRTRRPNLKPNMKPIAHITSPVIYSCKNKYLTKLRGHVTSLDDLSSKLQYFQD